MEPICFDQNQAQYLPAMAAGECVASLAITEPDAGSDMQVALLKYFLYSPRAAHAKAVNYQSHSGAGYFLLNAALFENGPQPQKLTSISKTERFFEVGPMGKLLPRVNCKIIRIFGP